ncbi:hypothetical protein [Jannaschia sp. LMIT008]|uniref:PIN-like domain-containing protein n=1 Tax=Jannaschia maritima TaxID=3032585 RepID=UPI0035ABEC5D
MTITVVFDHNVSPLVPRSLHPHLANVGNEAVALCDRYPSDISDIDLFARMIPAGRHVLVTIDRRQTRRKAER